MDSNQHDPKNVSEVFSTLRAKLNAKEKELLELQRAEPCLLAPDSIQINFVLDAISSLHLSTQDGSFLFASNSNSASKNSSDNQSSTSVHSTGIESIKTLPTDMWLSERKVVKEQEKEKGGEEEEQQQQQVAYRLPMVTHLFSLPLKNFVASSSNVTKPSSNESVVKKDDPPNRLPLVSQIFAMPLDAFKSSSKTTTMNETTLTTFRPQINEKKEIVDQGKKARPSMNETPKSVLDGDSVYSKDYWLRRSKTSTSNNDTNDTTTDDRLDPFDLDQYIEQTSEKMRRLHLEYLSAIEQLKSPSPPMDSTSAIKSLYPQALDRIQPDLPMKNKTLPQSSSK